MVFDLGLLLRENNSSRTVFLDDRGTVNYLACEECCAVKVRSKVKNGMESEVNSEVKIHDQVTASGFQRSHSPPVLINLRLSLINSNCGIFVVVQGLGALLIKITAPLSPSRLTIERLR